MSEREINALMRNVRKLEVCADYERESADTMELVSDAYTEYQNTLNYN